jgi:2-C-methyl-D-erythritol 4-phosphate cytidylyltransferase
LTYYTSDALALLRFPAVTGMLQHAAPDPFPVNPRFFGLVPAAGVGTRMGAEGPKQYLRLGSKSLLEHSVHSLMADARVARVLVVVAPGAQPVVALPAGATIAMVGGSSRAQSVLNGLRLLARQADRSDRVLVHDAARPCLAAPDLAALIDGVGHLESGGLRAAAVADTLKRVEDGEVVGTAPRAGLWAAQTPQLFPLGILLDALEAAEDLQTVTDESSAVERLGRRPLVIRATAANPKVTTPADWPLAEAALKAQGRW